jgi:hypothetical protein
LQKACSELQLIPPADSSRILLGLIFGRARLFSGLLDLASERIRISRCKSGMYQPLLGQLSRELGYFPVVIFPLGNFPCAGEFGLPLKFSLCETPIFAYEELKKKNTYSQWVLAQIDGLCTMQAILAT